MVKVGFETNIKVSDDKNLLKTKQSNQNIVFSGHQNVLRTVNASSANLQAYHLVKPSKISFGKTIKEHRSWGANIINNSQPNKPLIKFKLWAPYADEVIVEVRNPEDKVSLTKEEVIKEGLRPSDTWAADWHMNAKTDDGKSTFIKLKKSDNNDGVFEEVEKLSYPNAMYRYILKKDGKEFAKVKDPVSKCQPHIFSWSQVYNQNSFDWGKQEHNWVNGRFAEKVSDLTEFDSNIISKAGLSAKVEGGKEHLSTSGMITSELHIGTATKEGDLVALKKEIDRIKESGVFNSILLMPVEGTYDNNWGYDGVDKYAVGRSFGDDKGKADAIKRNDLLKEVIKYCHEQKLNVGIDWVPSHMFASGPDPNDAKELGIVGKQEQSGYVLNKFGHYDNPGKWGGVNFNLEDNNLNVRSKVRDYLVNIPLYWVDNFHVDFIRADQTPEMGSNFTMKQIAAEIRHHSPHTVIQWEDHRINDGLTRDLRPDEKCYQNTEKHCDFIKAVENDNVSLQNIGGNEHWDFAFSHSLEANLRGKEIGGFKPDISTLFNNMMDIGGTKYMVSHDEIGNDSGARIIVKIITDRLNIWNNLKDIDGETPSQKGIRGYDAVEELAEKYLFDRKNWDASCSDICDKYGIKNISKKGLEDTINKAVAKHKLGLGVMFMASGSKMIFQGDEYGETNSFRFSRKQAFDEPSQDKQKGYNVQQAWSQAKLEPEKHTIQGVENFSKAMSDLLKRNNALQKNQPQDKLYDMKFIEDNNSQVLGIKRFNFKGNEIIALYNFSDKNYENYDIKNQGQMLPAGNWQETINSDYSKFGGNENCINKGKIFISDGNTPASVKIPANGVVILEKVDGSGKVINGEPLKL